MAGEWSAHMMPLLENDQITSFRSAESVRLAVKPSATASGVLDGGWWPRSRDPVAELPALIAAIDRPGQHVVRVGLSMPAWTAAPRKLMVGGRKVQLDWFQTWNPTMVRLLIGSNRRQMDLLMIPVETSENTAIAALARAAAPDNTDSGVAILADAVVDAAARNHSHDVQPATAVTLRIPLPPWAEHAEEDDWESEGGRVKQLT
jgi:hypothetical protein